MARNLTAIARQELSKKLGKPSVVQPSCDFQLRNGPVEFRGFRSQSTYRQIFAIANCIERFLADGTQLVPQCGQFGEGSSFIEGVLSCHGTECVWSVFAETGYAYDMPIIYFEIAAPKPERDVKASPIEWRENSVSVRIRSTKRWWISTDIGESMRPSWKSGSF